MTIQAYQYAGGYGTVAVPNPPVISPRDPTTSDTISANGNPYQLLQGWRNSLTGTLFQYAGAGSWIEVSQAGTGPITSLTGNSGGAIAPIAGNINILGNNQATFVGTAGALTLTQTASGFPITTYVVGPSGFAGYQTIQAAVTAAGTTSAMIYVQPGTYTENITFVAASNVTIASLSPDSVTITGVHVPPSSGFVRFLEVGLTSATHIFSSAVAGTATLTVESCVVSCTNGFTFNLTNWTGTLQSFHSVHIGTANGFVTNSAGAPLFVSDSTVGNGTGQTMVTTGPISLEISEVQCPWSPTTGTVITCYATTFSQAVTLGGNTTGNFNNCSWSTGATASITMSSSAAITVTNSRVTSSANPAIAGAGAGVLTLGGVDFTSNTALAGTLTIGAADIFKAGSFQARSATNAAGASPQVVNSRVGQAIFTDVIANGAYGTLTVTNSSVAATSIINANVSCITVNSALSIAEITPTGGSVAFRIFNAGAASTADNILLNFTVLN